MHSIACSRPSQQLHSFILEEDATAAVKELEVKLCYILAPSLPTNALASIVLHRASTVIQFKVRSLLYGAARVARSDFLIFDFPWS